MRCDLLVISLSGALAGALMLTGCSKSGSGSASVMDPAKVPAAMSQAFDKAPEGTKSEATSCVTALQGKDAATAFEQLQMLRRQGDLSPEQRAVVARAMQTTFKQVQAAAESGNPAARAVVHKYLSTR